MSREYEIYDVKAEMYECHPDILPNTVIFKLHWSANLGWGELTFFHNEETEEWSYDSECMDKEFCAAVLNKWLDSIMKD